jgi:hypothetical protein
MTTLSISSVGLCAHFSTTGDRALRYALSLARARGLQLNVFSFLQSPFGAHGPLEVCTKEERDRLMIQTEYGLRSYYEDRLRDYLDVGFKVCEGDEEVELRRCLKGGEYQLLVIPYLEHGGYFANMPVEEFANRFLSPVVLVGPWRKVRYYLNAQAAHLADRLHLYEGTWRQLPQQAMSCKNVC